MTQEQIDDIVACLPRGRTVFRYFRDRYALLLLSQFVGTGKSVAEVKASHYGGLLKKPLLRAVTRKLADGRLTGEALASVWPPMPEAYLLTLGTWGKPRSRWGRGYYQTSRPGLNLVLQLNFSAKHNRRFEKLIDHSLCNPFSYSGHPIARAGYLTLSWARLDIDLDAGEALIEEIQSDWIKLATLRVITLERIEADGVRPRIRQDLLQRFTGDPMREDRYLKEVLAPHMKLWDEATLCAAIWFLRRELGIRRIFYHTSAGGTLLKGMLRRRKPPASLYTTLPRRFCFAETAATPAFLRRHLPKHQPVRFFLLES